MRRERENASVETQVQVAGGDLCFITEFEAHDSRAVLVALRVGAVSAAVKKRTLGGPNIIHWLSPSMVSGRPWRCLSFRAY